MKVFIGLAILLSCYTVANLAAPAAEDKENEEEEGMGEMTMKLCEKCMAQMLPNGSDREKKEIEALIMDLAASQAGNSTMTSVTGSDANKSMAIQIFICMGGEFLKTVPNVGASIFDCIFENPSSPGSDECEVSKSLQNCIMEKIESANPSSETPAIVKRSILARSLYL